MPPSSPVGLINLRIVHHESAIAQTYESGFNIMKRNQFSEFFMILFIFTVDCIIVCLLVNLLFLEEYEQILSSKIILSLILVDKISFRS